MRQRKKVVLFNPYAVFYTMPLSLIAIASNLDSAKYEVVVIDSRLEKNSLNRVISEAHDAVCIGITVLTGDPIRHALEASRAVKKLYPGVKIIWGGWHPSLFPTETLKEESIDITVQGQGEVTFSELVEAISGGTGIENIKGISYKSGGKLIQNPPRELKDMNDFDYQKYDLIPVDNYYKLKGQRQFDFISSIGCYFRCAFCADPHVYNRKWSALSPERMGNEIEKLWTKYKFEELAFQDETFFTHKQRAISIAEEFLKRGLKFKWTATMRADQGFRLSEDVIKLLVKSGLRWALIGVESGSDEMLKWLKKDITIEQVMYCAEMFKKYGLAAHFPVIVGFPGETEKSVELSLNIAHKLRQMSPKFETPIFYYKPYPGSAITKEAIDGGYKLPETLEEWADFDYIGSSGPWVNNAKYELVEKFKFYNRFAGGRETMMRKPLQVISRWRFKKNNFSFPIEKAIVERIKPSIKLS